METQDPLWTYELGLSQSSPWASSRLRHKTPQVPHDFVRTNGLMRPSTRSQKYPKAAQNPCVRLNFKKPSLKILKRSPLMWSTVLAIFRVSYGIVYGPFLHSWGSLWLLMKSRCGMTIQCTRSAHSQIHRLPVRSCLEISLAKELHNSPPLIFTRYGLARWGRAKLPGPGQSSETFSNFKFLNPNSSHTRSKGTSETDCARPLAWTSISGASHSSGGLGRDAGAHGFQEDAIKTIGTRCGNDGRPSSRSDWPIAKESTTYTLSPIRCVYHAKLPSSGS